VIRAHQPGSEPIDIPETIPNPVAPHSHTNEQIVWMLKGKMEFRLGSEQRVCGQGDVVVIPGGTEHEAWIHEDTEVIDFFAPPRDDFLLGGKPAYMSEG
jgi:quercetin dioxygenase-like cupin family protein